MEFLRNYSDLMTLALVLVQIGIVWLLWPRPIRKEHTMLMIGMVCLTTACPLLFCLVASEVMK